LLTLSKKGIGSEGIESLINMIQEKDIVDIHPSICGDRDCVNYINVYKEYLKSVIKLYHPLDCEKPLHGVKVVVNPGYGAAYFLIDLLRDLGADTSASIHDDINEKNPKHIANPEDKLAMDYTMQAVLNSKADLGIVLDTDGDRCGIVDGSGKLLNRNGLIAIVAKIAIKNAGDVIITDSSTSNGLKKFVESLNGQLIRYKKGYRSVIELGKNTPNAVAAIEASGHGGWAINRWIDDGCYTSIRVLIELHRHRLLTNNNSATISELLGGFVEPKESIEVRLNILGGYKDIKSTASHALQVFQKIPSKNNEWVAEKVNYEGLRIAVTNAKYEGWIMCRPSLHEPILSIQVESDNIGGTKNILKVLYENGFKELENILNMQPIIDIII
jgi:phosphomannomutase